MTGQRLAFEMPTRKEVFAALAYVAFPATDVFPSLTHKWLDMETYLQDNSRTGGKWRVGLASHQLNSFVEEAVLR